MIDWTDSEWHDDPRAASAYIHGYTADVYPVDGKWFWRVDITSALSEFPEVQDCGHVDTIDAAKEAAERCLTTRRR